MFILIPVGVDEHTVDRMPVISIGIAVACALAFLVTWVFPLGSDGEKEAREVMRRWVQQPDLVLPPTFVERFVGPTYEPILRRRAAAAAARNPRARPVTAEDQAQIDELAQRAVAESDASLLRRFSLVPSRGPWQAGWFTSMFLHFGWMHLLGNLLFFYICGPLLEDRWGRLLFLAFYLGCGLLAAMAQYAAEPHFHGMIAGASGAIAGCMGAFSFRHARRRVRMGYLFWLIRIFRGTFAISAWLWGIAWFVLQLADYALGGSRGGGVAVAAHLGGFIAGGVFALLLAGTGIEKRFVAPAVDRKVGWSQHPEFFVGIEALERGNPAAARRAFQAVLSERPDQLDARIGLARASMELGDPGARVELEAVVARVLAAGPEALRNALEQLGPVAEPDRLRPATAWRVAQTLDAAGDTRTARQYYAPARKLEGLVGLKARLRALELDPAPSPDEVNSVRTEAGGIPELAPRAEMLLRSVMLDDSGAIELPADDAALEIERHSSAEPPAPAPRPTPRVVPVRIVGRENGRLDVASASGVNPLPLRRVLGIAVGVVPAENGKNAVLTDLVIGWSDRTRGATVLRATLADLGLQRLYPGIEPRTAYARFLADIEGVSRAMRLPAGVDPASFPRYASPEEMTRACHELGGGG